MSEYDDSLEDAAESLITATSGILTQENIQIVVDALRIMINGLNDKWERHLIDSVGSVLTVAGECEDCGGKVTIERTNDTIFMGPIERQ